VTQRKETHLKAKSELVRGVTELTVKVVESFALSVYVTCPLMTFLKIKP